jgi:hypothetical protein
MCVRPPISKKQDHRVSEQVYLVTIIVALGGDFKGDVFK